MKITAKYTYAGANNKTITEFPWCKVVAKIAVVAIPETNGFAVAVHSKREGWRIVSTHNETILDALRDVARFEEAANLINDTEIK